MEVTCPSGLRGVVDALRGKDASILGDQRALRTGKAADSILRACWKEILDPGPYKASPALQWSHVLTGDRIFALLQVRIATYGRTEELSLQCPACRHKFVWDLPLDELEVRPYPKATIDAIRNGTNRFETKLGDTVVAFKLMTGNDQVQLGKVIRERTDDILTASLEHRIVDVEGIDKKEIADWLDNLTMGEVQQLADAFEEVDGGVNTVIDVYCNVCAHEWELDLPLDLTRMFVPKRAGRRRERR